MAKFTSFSEEEQIVFLKDEFVLALEELILDSSDNSKIKPLVPEDKFKEAVAYLPNIKEPDCTCGSCLNVEKIESGIPSELDCIIEVARKRCEEREF